MHAIFHVNHPVTSVEHGVWCYFTTLKYKQLITFGANQMIVYRLGCRDSSETTSSFNSRAKLEQVASYRLFGNVVSVAVVRRSAQPDGEQDITDALIVTLKPALCVLLCYDPISNDIRPLSLYDYDESEATLCDRPTLPEIRVDPEMRCAAFVAHGSKVVIIPLKKELQDDRGTSATEHFLQIYRTLASFEMLLFELEEPVANVLDMQFLHGYFEPTLQILYQPIQTWPGRLATRKDTVAMITMSLNLTHQAYPIIWSQSGLPFDCFKLLAVPKPIGGSLVFGANVLIYLNQSIPPYGVMTNSLARGTTDFLLTAAYEEKIAFDTCRMCLLESDKVAVILKTGDIHIITLLTDEMRAVKSFNFQKAATSVLTCCIVHLGDNYIFLGSRLANSLLLYYSKSLAPVGRIRNTALSRTPHKQPANKKRRLNTVADYMEVAPDEIDHEIYGEAILQSESIAQVIYSYNLEVCDSILNIGPIGKTTVGESLYISEGLAQNSTDVESELLVGSGHDKNGAITILQKTIKPTLITTFELPNYMDLWTTMGSEVDEKGNQRHSCLILARNDSTAILETREEINEVEQSGFIYNETTIFAGNVDKNLSIQVTPTKVVLLEHTLLKSMLSLDPADSPIVYVSVTDLFIFLLTSTGKFHIVQMKRKPDEMKSVELTFLKKDCDHQSGFLVTSGCLYKDVSELFAVGQKVANPVSSGKTLLSQSSKVQEGTNELTVEQEEELLFGEKSQIDLSQVFSGISKVKSEPSEDKKANVFKYPKVSQVSPTYWCAVGLQNGMLQVLSLPDLKPCFTIQKFYHAKRSIPVSGNHVEIKTESHLLGEDLRTNKFPINELLIVGLGPNKCRPHLFALLNDELVIYEIKESVTTQPQGTLQVSLHKFCHDTLMHQYLGERRVSKKTPALYTGLPGAQEEEEVLLSEDGYPIPKSTVARLVQRIRVVENVSGYHGVFVCGFHPLWILMTDKGLLRPHIMWHDGAIINYANLNNINCPAGFLYFTQKNQLRIALLPSNWDYDAYWPTRKLNIKATVQHVSYHLQTKAYCVVTTCTEPVNRMPRLVLDKLDPELLERDENYVYPTITKFALRVMQPDSWQFEPDVSWESEEWDHITALKCVKLANEGERSALQEYVVIGCSQVYGEELPCRGWIRMFDLTVQKPTEEDIEKGNTTKKKFNLRLICEHEQKGPITAINAVEGFLVSSSGQKIFIHTFQYQKFTACAFVDATPFTLGIHTMKSFVLSNDIYKSIILHKFDPKTKAFSLISKDTRRVESMASTFLVDNKLMGFLVSDTKCNLNLLMYQPELKESHSGQRLVKMVDFNAGCKINSFVNIKCKSLFFHTQQNDQRKLKELDNKMVSYFGTLDGALGYVLPVQEKLYRRLRMLQNTMYSVLVQSAGLNPKAYRYPLEGWRLLANSSKGIVDGDLIFQFPSLSLPEKLEIADRIGIDMHYILDDLAEVHHCTCVF